MLNTGNKILVSFSYRPLFDWSTDRKTSTSGLWRKFGVLSSQVCQLWC